MAGNHGASRTGVCIVRAETDASARLLITITARRNVEDATRESVLRTVSVETALACVADFLAAVGDNDTETGG